MRENSSNLVRKKKLKNANKLIGPAKLKQNNLAIDLSENSIEVAQTVSDTRNNLRALLPSNLWKAGAWAVLAYVTALLSIPNYHRLSRVKVTGDNPEIVYIEDLSLQRKKEIAAMTDANQKLAAVLEERNRPNLANKEANLVNLNDAKKQLGENLKLKKNISLNSVIFDVMEKLEQGIDSKVIDIAKSVLQQKVKELKNQGLSEKPSVEALKVITSTFAPEAAYEETRSVASNSLASGLAPGSQNCVARHRILTAALEKIYPDYKDNIYTQQFGDHVETIFEVDGQKHILKGSIPTVDKDSTSREHRNLVMPYTSELLQYATNMESKDLPGVVYYGPKSGDKSYNLRTDDLIGQKNLDLGNVGAPKQTRAEDVKENEELEQFLAKVRESESEKGENPVEQNPPNPEAMQAELIPTEIDLPMAYEIIKKKQRWKFEFVKKFTDAALVYVLNSFAAEHSFVGLGLESLSVEQAKIFANHPIVFLPHLKNLDLAAAKVLIGYSFQEIDIGISIIDKELAEVFSKINVDILTLNNVEILDEESANFLSARLTNLKIGLKKLTPGLAAIFSSSSSKINKMSMTQLEGLTTEAVQNLVSGAWESLNLKVDHADEKIFDALSKVLMIDTDKSSFKIEVGEEVSVKVLEKLAQLKVDSLSIAIPTVNSSHWNALNKFQANYIFLTVVKELDLREKIVKEHNMTLCVKDPKVKVNIREKNNSQYPMIVQLDAELSSDSFEILVNNLTAGELIVVLGDDLLKNNYSKILSAYKGSKLQVWRTIPQIMPLDFLRDLLKYDGDLGVEAKSLDEENSRILVSEFKGKALSIIDFHKAGKLKVLENLLKAKVPLTLVHAEIDEETAKMMSSYSGPQLVLIINPAYYRLIDPKILSILGENSRIQIGVEK